MDKNNKKQNNDASITEDLLRGMSAELFDPDTAYAYVNAKNAACMFWSLFKELKRAGFSRDEAFEMILTICGKK